MLCEKPFTRHPEEVDAAFDTADRTGRLLSEAFMYRHNPQTKRARGARRGGRDRRAPARPLAVQLLAVRRREHPAAHRRRRRRADGRRLLHRQRLAPLRRRADARTGEAWFGPPDRLGLRRHAPRRDRAPPRHVELIATSPRLYRRDSRPSHATAVSELGREDAVGQARRWRAPQRPARPSSDRREARERAAAMLADARRRADAWRARGDRSPTSGSGSSR